MKKIKFFRAALFLFAAISLISCTGDNEPLDPAIDLNDNGDNAAVFKADFDGQTFTANTTQAIVNDDYISINGRKSSGEFFQITIPNAAVGTYTWDDFDTTGGFALAYSGGSGSIPYLGARDDVGTFADFANYTDTAEITITSIDIQNHKISGTFHFTGVRFADGSVTTVTTKTFTNGSFTNLPYTGDTTAPTGNVFTAKLDGATYTPTNITGMKMSGMISLVGRRGNIENIGLSMPDNAVAGAVYPFTAFSSDARGQYIDSASGIYGGDGTMTIISHDVANKRIKGTFSFTASTVLPPTTTHAITEGTFDVTYL
ncbi:DUF6252 family protein [Flavobacterium sp. GT3R68]|uniref:DUF6252 family protein n=1 Tax=Flavobacterium sp. GT3R68 TaxID=2594437 RepID=UPI000F873796|nr:DUF6252 family protein [Flavobacterium sp. GT3R68]RTY86456.1 hypothetical protein EKL32_27685 [Flavobacterium sp. GSN2]TRW91546.1 hypothetical protein FNW07_06545 [Flavobacterium sp. GT3R68]